MTYTSYATNTQFVKLRQKVTEHERRIVELENQLKHFKMLKTGW